MGGKRLSAWSPVPASGITSSSKRTRLLGSSAWRTAHRTPCASIMVAPVALRAVTRIVGLLRRSGDEAPAPYLSGERQRHGCDRTRGRVCAQRPDEWKAGEVEDATVTGDHEIPVPEADHPHDGLVQRL